MVLTLYIYGHMPSFSRTTIKLLFFLTQNKHKGKAMKPISILAMFVIASTLLLGYGKILYLSQLRVILLFMQFYMSS